MIYTGVSSAVMSFMHRTGQSCPCGIQRRYVLLFIIPDGGDDDDDDDDDSMRMIYDESSPWM